MHFCLIAAARSIVVRQAPPVLFPVVYRGNRVPTQSRATPDGYTLLLATASDAVNATFYDKLDFNLIRDIAPVAGISRYADETLCGPSHRRILAPRAGAACRDPTACCARQTRGGPAPAEMSSAIAPDAI
jgi:hypothetical protein